MKTKLRRKSAKEQNTTAHADAIKDRDDGTEEEKRERTDDDDEEEEEERKKNQEPYVFDEADGQK